VVVGSVVVVGGAMVSVVSSVSVSTVIGGVTVPVSVRDEALGAARPASPSSSSVAARATIPPAARATRSSAARAIQSQMGDSRDQTIVRV
jgi:hypothetical protein